MKVTESRPKLSVLMPAVANEGVERGVGVEPGQGEVAAVGRAQHGAAATTNLPSLCTSKP